jgi:hypothetical protein
MKRATFYVGLPADFTAGTQSKIEKALAMVYGGSTWVKASGTWVSPAMVLVRDHSAVIVVFTDRSRADLETTASYLADLLGQDEVYLTVERGIDLHVARRKGTSK